MGVDIKSFFQTYVYGWMCADIVREIEWAREGKPAGNALCALGLLAYTEFMASLLPEARRPQGGARQQFDAFFRELGVEYAAFLDSASINVYDTFRCGLAHEYFVKRTCTIAMLNSPAGVLEVKGPRTDSGHIVHRAEVALVMKPASCGIGMAHNGSLYFIVEKYYQDFRAACERLEIELARQDPPPPPPVRYTQMSDSGGPR